MSAEELDGGRDLFDDSWMLKAACRGLPAGLFHPARGDGVEGRRVCVTCPVRAACLDYAIATDQRAGMWGGYGERARRVIARQRRRATHG